MPKYGIISDDKLVLTDETYPGAKPVVYADVSEFDQLSLYIVQQQVPVDVGSHIFVGIEIREVPPHDNDEELVF